MDSDVGSAFEDDGASSDFMPDPAPKAKAKVTTAKKPAKPKAPVKKATQTATTSKPATKPTAKKRPRKETENASDEDVDMRDDDSILSSTPPQPPKKSKTTAGSKKSAGNPLAAMENEAASTAQSKGNSGDQYQKLTQKEHIIRRPDTYIGSVERTQQQMWVFNSTTEQMEFREVSYVPGLYKIFDEILVNAADNKQRDSSMSEIRVTLDKEAGEISVWNNGRGIPVEIHSKEKIYIPELIFGHLLTSSNYDDDQAKVTGGRNGYGAKLCNIFSTEFTVETADSNSKKKYKQTWKDNMSVMGKAKIADVKGDDYTKITFKPDFMKFGMEGMDDDFEALVKRRVYDLAGTCKVNVKLNGTKIALRGFKKYMEMYTKAIKNERGEEATSDKSEIVTDSPDPRWEIGFAVSDGSFQQVSFVNSIATTSGGTHVNYISDQICAKLAESVKKKNKTGPLLKPAQIRNHIFLFVNCLIVNPAFTSQTKEQLTTKPSQFGSKCTLSEDFLKKILKTQVMQNIMHFAEQKADQILKKTDGSRRARMNNPKLTDANKAGTKEGHHCTLILTEGDSAKGLAMAGRAVVGPDLFGVFPLRGKLLNVRDASVDQISKNQEIQNIKNFLGLQHKKEYADTRGLRYGHLMIMTDQDHDGSHIKGLLINYLQVAFPSLLKIPGFLIEFITPIVKVWKGDPKQPTATKSFFTIPEYEAWKEVHGHDRRWDKKYYKGLGTSSTEDAEIYFRDLDRHLKEFHALQDNEAQLIDLAFSKKKADERKEWLRQFKPGTYLDHSVEKISYTDFINKELILFSMADNIRSIPSVVDGLKPGQRKVLYAMFKRNVRKDAKVVELGGYVSGMTGYQHGEVSLQQTIVGLAQTFVGSNNVNCLEPSGNFGSRLQGGSDCASARYIHTRLSPFARRIFSTADDPLLKHNVDDGKIIEPEVFVPVVPLVLINGADGIGTGWSTSIPNFNPEDIVDNLKRLMDGEPVVPMKPWFRGFTGEVTAAGDRYKFSGIIKQTGDYEVEITELPIRTWTQDFKDKLEEIIKAEKAPSFIKDYKDYNTHSKVHFIIQMDEKHMKKAVEDGLEERFKLSRTITTSNMVAFDAEGRITKYNTAEDILEAFFAVRIRFYEKRKQFMLAQLHKELEKLTNQARFVQMIIDGKLVIAKKPKAKLMQELKEKAFKPFPKGVDAAKEGEDEPTVENDESEEEEKKSGSDGYDYLLGMALWSLTQERVAKLLRQMGDKELEIDALIKLSKEDLWRRDLDEFIAEWRYQLEDEERRAKKSRSYGRRTSTKLKTAGPAAKKRKATDGGDSDFAPKAKKTAIVNKVKPKGGLLDYLGKSSAKPKPKSTGLDGASDMDDSEAEVMPRVKARAAPTKKPQAITDFAFSDSEHDKEEQPPKRPSSKAVKSRVSASPEFSLSPSKEDDRSESEKGSKVESEKAKEEKEEEEDSDLEIVSKPRQRAARMKRKPVVLDESSSSENDDGDDLLGDVSKMVKGLGSKSADPVAGSPTLFSSEYARPGAGVGSKPMPKALKAATELDLDETDYSKLIPLNSPRRSLLVKPKDGKDPKMDGEEGEKPTTTKAKPGPRAPAKTSKTAPSTGARANTQKAGKRTVAPTKKLQLSPAAKAYASKKTKSSKALADELSDDDIDAMANDILESSGSEQEPAAKAPAPTRARPARRAATTTKKPTYVIDDDSDDGFSSPSLDDDFSDD
ncbi:DNA topoisomerase 2 [Uncinocarpus reesii 1704]|uniref:DNA topoisomerase 2 n=1 Tax=Uncinocarpus reesii (strain UAMH 1704) TaxID=336963 RepID=C4JNJ9_UNCRE|nr:DNA topoisomerase 2 [Uncinocarpus reesii 1704]EEP78152.1 DNA topoisomerase 2 [Uncinocarpus reesii 1704]